VRCGEGFDALLEFTIRFSNCVRAIDAPPFISAKP
jgi:hypothetical protein